MPLLARPYKNRTVFRPIRSQRGSGSVLHFNSRYKRAVFLSPSLQLSPARGERAEKPNSAPDSNNTIPSPHAGEGQGEGESKGNQAYFPPLSNSLPQGERGPKSRIRHRTQTTPSPLPMRERARERGRAKATKLISPLSPTLSRKGREGRKAEFGTGPKQRHPLSPRGRGPGRGGRQASKHIGP